LKDFNNGELRGIMDYKFDPTSPMPVNWRTFGPDHECSANATLNLKELFKDVFGCEEVVKKLGGYQCIGRDPRDLIPTNFVFEGPPGVFSDGTT
jgi:hypothetical protein